MIEMGNMTAVIYARVSRSLGNVYVIQNYL